MQGVGATFAKKRLDGSPLHMIRNSQGSDAMQPVTTSQTLQPQAQIGVRTRPPVRWGKVFTILLFLLPPLLLYTYLVIYPVVQGLYYSVYKWNGLGAPT